MLTIDILTMSILTVWRFKPRRRSFDLSYRPRKLKPGNLPSEANR